MKCYVITVLLLSSLRVDADANATAQNMTEKTPPSTVPVTTAVPTKEVEENLCIKVFGECLLANATCPDQRSFVNFMCGKDTSKKCCIPNQSDQKLWQAYDEECTNEYGECKLDTASCSGKFTDLKCGGPTHRRCCMPDANEVKKWKEKDGPCIDALGTCQLDSDECNGQFQAGTCGGPRQRKCCLPGKKDQEEWEKKDGSCLAKWGKCQSKISICEGSRNKNLCGGPDNRECCVPDMETIKQWENGDKDCHLDFGECVQSASNCSGKLDQMKCGGPSFRQCCIPDAESVKAWSQDDKLCTDKGGVCQSIASPCKTKYREGYCGGPSAVRQCCLNPVKKDEIQNLPDGGSSNSNKIAETTKKILKELNNHLTVVLAVSIPLTIAFLISVCCLIRRRSRCCKPYTKLRGDPRKTPWYKMEYNDVEEEDVNLTAHDENSKVYA